MAVRQAAFPQTTMIPLLHHPSAGPVRVAAPQRKRIDPMKASTRLLMILSVFALGLVGLAEEPVADPWQKVDEAVKKGLPKTAIEHLNPILARALRDRAYPEAVKAISRKVALEGIIQGNKPEEKITRM